MTMDDHLSQESQVASPAGFKNARTRTFDASNSSNSVHMLDGGLGLDTKQSTTKLVNGTLRLRIARACDTDPSNFYIRSFERILRTNARQIASLAGIDYDSLGIIDRLLLTKFRCSLCGDLPFYFLDLRHINRVRCGRCSSLTSLKNSGKYGKMRKMIAISACREIDETLNSDPNQALDQMR